MSISFVSLVTPAVLLLLAADPAPAPPQASDFRALYREARPAVVRIHTQEGNGTGFLVGDGTRVVTALHVLTGEREVTIETFAGERVEATLFAWDPDDDLAVLKLPSALDGTGSLAVAGPAEQPQVGDTLVAIGHPLLGSERLDGKRKGLLEWSMTAGMASAVGEHRIQTTASVQSGNSGGPVLDLEGRVVGVVSARHGDFGIATRTARLVQLLERPAPMVPAGPTVGGGMRTGLTFQWHPKPGAMPEFDLGGSLNFYLELDGRVDLGFVARMSRRNNPVGEADKRDRIDLLFKGGPKFSVRGPGNTTIGLRPFFTTGLQLIRERHENTTMQLADADCDPSVESCEATIDTSVEWTTAPGWYMGGGIGFDFGPSFLEFEVGTNLLDPDDLRFMITWGLRFGAPARIPKAKQDEWDAELGAE